MTAKFAKFLGVVAVSAALAGCASDFTRDSKSPSLLVIASLQGASGAQPNELGTFVLSDVLTLITAGGVCTTDNPCPTRFNDIGQVELRVLLRDVGAPSPNTPSALNSVTITRYHVKYVRSDGRNQQGTDVPYEFDGAVSVTVPSDGSATFGFQLVRNAAKFEAPLAALINDSTLITTIAEVTFWGRDQAGNEVTVKGSIDVTFGNFGDPA